MRGSRQAFIGIRLTHQESAQLWKAVAQSSAGSVSSFVRDVIARAIAEGR